jgi:hypothetical protein
VAAPGRENVGFQAVPRRYGKNILKALMAMVTCLNRLSDSLRIDHADDDPARLGPPDISAFLQRPATCNIRPEQRSRRTI